jgi:transcriptional regulator with XRE-family HTH domain
MKRDNSIAHDLAVARQKAGLRQLDCAHLLGVTESRISHLETGISLPTTKQLVMLSIVYGKPMEALASGSLDEILSRLIERLETIPPIRKDTTETFNRTRTLSKLAVRLEALTSRRYGGQ